MGWNNMGMLIEVKEKMNADQYCQILGDRMVESFEKLEIVVDEQYFQQDNDPKHTSKKATQYNNIQLLLWPAQSSDLDHVEYLWKHVKWQFSKYKISPKGVYELWDRLVNEWNRIAPEVCQNLI